VQQRERVERAIANELRRQATLGVQRELLTGGITLFGVIDIPALALAVMRACDEAAVMHPLGASTARSVSAGFKGA
jgi:hypothetical protein